MKVGIILGSKRPDIGGGYAFENAIFNSLVELSIHSHHRFALCSEDKLPYLHILNSGHIELISLYRSFHERLSSKIYREVQFIYEKIKHPRTPLKIKSWYEQWIYDSLISKDVDLILYLSPPHSPVMDLPYITILWDLGHRIHPYFPEFSIKGTWELREKLNEIPLKRASVVVTGTKAGMLAVERFYQVPAERIRILPLPTPQFFLKSSPKDDINIFEKYNIPNNYLFYPAQFWSHKNHVGLLLAIKWLRDQYGLIFSVVFVGSDKGNKSYVKQVVTDLNLTEQVHFLGFVPQEDLIALYRNAFALTFLTFLGPDNLPPLEAFASGCPVIASNVSGAEEQLGEAALLVDPKDTKQIGLAIKSLWEDASLRQTLIQRGETRANQWTAKDYVKGLIEILDEFEVIRRCWSIKEF